MESQGCNDGAHQGEEGAADAQKLRFVLLRHERKEDTHWDFMLELPGMGGLATWQLPAEPAAGTMRARRLADHRREYLTYEGPISGGRGHVKRIDSGRISLEKHAPVEILAAIRGALFQFKVALKQEAADQWQLTFTNP